MKLGIMQPYFFPYIGYFQLMGLVDKWIVFDDIQFIDKGWINRNRVLHPDPNKEWQYITLPLDKRDRYDKIKDIAIKTDARWRDQIMGKLTSYKRKAPFYKPTIDFLDSCFENEEKSLSQFLCRCLSMTAAYLDINTHIEIQSEMNLSVGEVQHPGQWALRISEALKASEYVNPHGGIEIFKESEFEAAGIKLTFLRPKLEQYVQRRDGFVPGLSIIDVLMWNDLDTAREMLGRGYELLSKSEAIL